MEFFEALGHKEFKIVGVFFFHYALKGGVVLVDNGVAGLVVAHGSVAQTHGKVGVGIKDFIGLHFHESRNKQARGGIDLLLGFAIHAQEATVLCTDGASGLVGGVFAQFFETGLGQAGFEGVFEDSGAGGKAVDFGAVDQGFTQVVAGFVLGRTRGVDFLNGVQHFPVALLVGGTACCPLGKAGFQFAFLAEYVEGFEAAVHADAVFPIVGAA